MAPVELSLSGMGSVHKAPERGVVTVTIQKKGEDLDEVIEDVRKTSAKIQARVQILAARDDAGEPTEETAVMRWSNSGLISRTWKEVIYRGLDGEETPSHVFFSLSDYKRGQYKIFSRQCFQATVSITTRFRNFEQLSSYIVNLSTEPLVTVGSVSWMHTIETQELVQMETVRKAYLNAFTSAKAYADAMGMKTIRPIKIEDQSSGQSSGRSNGYGRSPMKMGIQMQQMQLQQQMQQPQAAQASSGDSSLSHMPQDLVEYGSCEVKFEIE